jgi:hypothetical protein
MSAQTIKKPKEDDMIQARFSTRSFVACMGILVAIIGSLFSQIPSAKDILARFCDLDAQGGQLSPEGWEKMAALFVTPGAPRREKILVVKDFAISDPAFDARRAQFYVEYLEVGQIESASARFSSLPSMNVRVSFDLVKASGIKSGAHSSEAEGPADWRIAGSMPAPHLTIGAAIRYATELSTNAKDAGIRQNADKSVAALKRLR